MENFLRLCASRDAIQSAFLGSGILGSASWAVSRREPAGEILNAMKDPGNKIIKMRLVGTGRFELPTPRTPSECSTRLSHVPTRKEPAASLPQRMGLTREFYHQWRSFVL